MTINTEPTSSKTTTEYSLNLSQQSIDMLFNSVSDGIALTNSEQEITRVNASLALMCGYENSELMIGKKLFDIVAHIDHVSLKNCIKKLEQKSSDTTYGCNILKFDRTRFTADIQVNLLSGTGDKSGQFMFIFKDRSDTVLLEEVMMAEQNYRKSLDESPLGILILNNEDRILYANQSLLELYGMQDFEELMNISLTDMMSHDSYAQYKERKRNRSQGKPVLHNYEMSIIQKNGETRHLMVFRRIVVWNGEICYQYTCYDITANKEALELHQALADNSPTSVYIVQDGNICYTNWKFLDTCGYSADEVMEMRISDFVYPEDRSLVAETSKRLLENGDTSSYEFRFIDKSGNVRWACESINSIMYNGKRAVIGNISDVTENKMMLEALNYSDAALKSIHEGVYVMDNEFTVTRWNNICEDMLGIPKEEAIGKHIWELLELIEDYPGQNDERIERLFNDQYNKEEQKYKTRKGSIWLEVYAQAVEMNGERQGWITILSDISGRKRIEKELRDSEEYLRSVITAIDDIVFTYDLDGRFSNFYKASEIVSDNIQSMGMSFVGKHFSEVLPEYVSEPMALAFSEALRTGENTKFEYSLEIAGGMRWYDARVSPMRDAEGEIFGVLIISRDISERVRAEKAVAESEQRIRSIMNAMDDLFFTYDLDGNFEAFYRISTYPEVEPVPKSFIGISYRDYLPEDVSDKMDKAFEQVLETGTNQQFDYCMSIADEDRWFDARVSPINDENQQITGVLIISREITERIVVETALAESEEKMRSLITSMDDIVFSFDLNGVFTHFYQPYHNNNLIVQSDQFIGKRYHDVLPDDVSEKLELALNDLLTTGQNQQFDYWVKPGDTMLCYNAKISPVLDRTGKITGVTAVTRDITDRKHMEDQIVEAAREWEATFDSMTESIYIIDTEYKILKANKACADSVGLELEDLIGAPCYKQLYNRNTPCQDCLVADVIKTKSQVFNEVEVKLRDKYLQIITSPIFGSDGEITSFITSARDVSSLKKIEGQLMQSQLLASLGTMTAGIAHEVNNPLGSVLLLSELLLKESAADDIKKDLKVIHGEAKRAAKIMSTLLTYRNRSVTHNRRLNISRIIKKVMSIRQYRQNVINIGSTVNIPDKPIYVSGDSSQLTQVLMNVIINAEEALESVPEANIGVDVQQDANWVRISVSDNGTGIPEENIDSVFHPFFTTKKVGEGTGLGLSTCYSIVASHNGLIRVENNDKGGATFIIELPLAGISNKKSKERSKNNKIVVEQGSSNRTGEL